MTPAGRALSIAAPPRIPLTRPAFGREEQVAVSRVLASGHLAQGPETAAFEDEFAAYLDAGSAVGDCTHAVAVSNGTTALQLALMALGIGPGDEVVLPAFTFVATANAVHAAGAIPVFADIDSDTMTIDPDAVRALVGPRTAALLPVHIYGHPADMTNLSKIAHDHGLAIVEDCAQAHGASIQGKRVGTNGIGCFSFYATKNLACGEGGMVTTRDAQLADRMRVLRNHGMRERYQFEGFGLNLRLNDLASAIGRVQLRSLDSRNLERRRNAAWLNTHLEGVVVPMVRPGVSHAYYQYTVRSTERDALRQRLDAAGVESGVYYPSPVHRTPQFETGVHLPVTEHVTTEILSLPVRPGLTGAELERIAGAVNT